MISQRKNKLQRYLFFNDFFKIKLGNEKKIAFFCQVAIHFHPGHPQLKIINTILCSLEGLLTKLIAGLLTIFTNLQPERNEHSEIEWDRVA